MKDWLPARRSQYSPDWGKQVDRMAQRQLLPAFGALRLDRIGRPTVERRFGAMSRKTPGAANTALAVLRQIMSAAKAVGHVGTDLVVGVRPNPTVIPALDRHAAIP